MAYRIDYSIDRKNEAYRGSLTRGLLTMLFFSAFLISVTLFWPEGREVLRLLMIPGDPDVTMEAAEAFVYELDCGSSLKNAATEFIQNVMRYGNIR